MNLTHHHIGSQTTETFVTLAHNDKLRCRTDGSGEKVFGCLIHHWGGKRFEIQFQVDHIPVLEDLILQMRDRLQSGIDSPPIDISTLRGCVVGPDEMDDIREPRKGLAGANCFVEGRPIVAEAACDVSPMDPSLDEG